MARITILYEDQADPGGHFGPHELLKRCLVDRLGDVPRWKIEAESRAVPLKGKEKLLKACREGRFLAGGGRVVAAFDDDHVRDIPALHLAPSACRPLVRKAILNGCPQQDRLVVVFPWRNVEALLATILKCDADLDADLVPDELRDRVGGLRHLDINERDIILRRAANAASSLLDRLFERLPALEYLVRKIHEAWVAETVGGCG